MLLAYASYNPYHNNVYKDALLTSFINSATSFVSGFVIFSVLGYMAHTSGQKIEDVATEGPGLVFDVYPGLSNEHFFNRIAFYMRNYLQPPLPQCPAQFSGL